MKSSNQPSAGERRVEEPRRHVEQRTADSAPKAPVTRFVDPYDMRAEPQPEEPGYGHGV